MAGNACFALMVRRKNRPRLPNILYSLTPQMDRLFIEGSSNRRRFLDRLVYAFDLDHATRVNAYSHALRERARLLRTVHRTPVRGAGGIHCGKSGHIAAARIDLFSAEYGDRGGSGPFPAPNPAQRVC